MSDNTVTLIGNITRDPELRYTSSGFTTVGFGLAVNRRRANKEQPGEWIEETSFFNVKVLGDQADNVAETLQKGARVIVTGRLEQRSWEANGEKKSIVEIVADEVGPSLRWATAKVERTERKGGDGGSGFGGGGGGNAGGSRPVANEPPPGYGYDEEPF